MWSEIRPNQSHEEHKHWGMMMAMCERRQNDDNNCKQVALACHIWVGSNVVMRSYQGYYTKSHHNYEVKRIRGGTKFLISLSGSNVMITTIN
jgi:hypothetical protein